MKNYKYFVSGLRSIYLLVFGIVFLASYGCTLQNFQQPTADGGEEVTDSLRVEKRDQIAREAHALFSSVQSGDTLAYAIKKRSLENSITEYLRLTNDPSDELMLFNYNGSIILFPTTIVQNDSIIRQTSIANDPKILWEQISPTFQGEILDLKIIPGAEGNPSLELAVLFPDSLLIFQNYLMETRPLQVIHFNEANQSRIKSMYPGGQISVKTYPSTTKLNLITSCLQNPLSLQRSSINFQLDTTEDTTAGYDLISNWRSINGQGIFQPAEQQIIPFRSFRNIEGSTYSIVLDGSGFLHLLDKTKNSFVWSSDRPWGDRIFTLNMDSIAVINSETNSFVLFRRQKEQLFPIGESEPFPRDIFAISPAVIRNNPGYLIAFRESQKEMSIQSMIQFIPEDRLLLQENISYPVRTFPDYQQIFTLMLNSTSGVRAQNCFNFPTSLYRNIYETLFTYDTNENVKPALVTHWNSDTAFKRWEFKLKENIYFSNGTALNAEQVRASWEEHAKSCPLSSKENSWMWLLLKGGSAVINGTSEHFSGISILDENTLRIDLEYSVPSFPDILTHQCFAPFLSVNNVEYPIGTGPFVISRIDSNNNIRAFNTVRNNYYHGGMPPIRELIVKEHNYILFDSLSQFTNSGAVTFRSNDIAYFRKINTKSVHAFPIEEMYYIAVNPNSEPLNDTPLRQSIVTSIDREITTNIISEVQSIPIETFFAESIDDISEKLSIAPQKFTHRLKIEYLNNDITAQHIAERLAARLSQLKIPHQSPSGISQDSLVKQKYEATYDILIESFIPQFVEDINNLNLLLNRNYVIPEEIHNKLVQGLQYPDKNISNEIEQTLIEQAFLYPVIKTIHFAVIPTNMESAALYASDFLDLSNAWLPQ